MHPFDVETGLPNIPGFLSIERARRVRYESRSRYPSSDPAMPNAIGFAVTDPATVDAWRAAGVANGGTTCEDPPGVREGGMGRMYLAYLRDHPATRSARCTAWGERRGWAPELVAAAFKVFSRLGDSTTIVAFILPW